MGAFGEFLGFDGRIDRVGYLWRSVAAVALIVILACAGAALLINVVRPTGAERYEVGSQALTDAIVLLVLWSTIALASRRLRDMGLEPAHIVPLYVALWVVNVVLLEPLSRQTPEAFGSLEAAWTVLQVLAVVPLLFWPGREVVTPLARFDRPEPTAYLNWRESGG
ncbi:MAG TPA: DUF805 domain-containing protein [Caulobacteraceae bacterium]|nr:DUF805 domain-containing protein [Caulobacteraceae bacterium]